MLDQLLTWVQRVGLPGLFVFSAVDSGGIPTGGGPDLLVALLAVQRPVTTDVLWAAFVAALGSTVGCTALFLGARLGAMSLATRFGEARVARARRWLRRFGPAMVVISVVAPPPYPMKLFIVGAGLLDMGLWSFSLAVMAGRSLRYAVVGLLAARYGQAVLARLADEAVLWGAGLIVAGLLVFGLHRMVLRRRRRGAPDRGEQSGTR